MIRAILAVLAILLFLIITLPVLAFFYFYGKKNFLKATDMQYKIVQFGFSVVLFVTGTKVIIKGAENVPENEACCFIGNHSSYFDIVVGYRHSPKTAGFIAKDVINKIPIFNIWMRRTGCLFLDRKNPKQGLTVIKTAIEYIEKGISIFVFPEGTRSKDGQLGEFKEGTMKIASRSGCPIVPVAFTGTRDIFEDHMPFVKKKTVILHYGKPVYQDDIPEEMKKHTGEYIKNIIADMLKEDAADYQG